ncbi:MAG: transcriptional regulator PpsR [Pseudomonadota bacterium]
MMSPDDQSWTSGLVPMIEPEVVSGIVSRIADLALIVSKTGHVQGVMVSPSFRIQSDLTEWEGHQLQDELTVESVPKLETRLREVLADGSNVLPVELNHCARSTHDEIPMRYSFHQLGQDGTILMLGSDLRSTAEMQQQLVAAQIALEKDYEAQRDHDLKFRVLMTATEDATFFVSGTSGEIADCNTAAATLFGKEQSDLKGAAFADLLDEASRDAILDRLISSASGQSAVPVAVTTHRSGADVVVRPTLFRTSGEQMLLCKIAPMEASGTAVDDLQTKLSQLFQSGVDSVVFVGTDGQILSCNEAFLSLTDVATAQSVKGRPLSDFLGRGSVDVKVLLENAGRAGSMRLYATKTKSELGADRSIEISTSKLNASGRTFFGMIIRDASRIEAVRPAPAQMNEVDMRSVIELIGGQSLKDIVAKTTDVVEKMCIETAVEMTSNNRVAAAEMLGLSRQSLYVKLRKYGLLSKDG